MNAIVDGLTIVALSRYSKNDNTARRDPDHFGTYIYRNFFDARLRLSRFSPFLAILFFPRFLLSLPLFPRLDSFSTRPPPSGRGSKGSLVPAENKKVKFSCCRTALSLPCKNNATWHFQRGCLVSPYFSATVYFSPFSSQNAVSSSKHSRTRLRFSIQIGSLLFV